MYLLDTNILLELLLDRPKADDVDHLFNTVPTEKIFISEFSLYSIGIFLHNRKMPDKFVEMIDDLIIKAGIQIARLRPEDMKELVKNAHDHGLDFDDAYQYTISAKYALSIVSFDSDFDKTDKGRIEPDKIC
jgi:predicted nucleic acid-binding protein